MGLTFSVIIPCYNTGSKIGKGLMSIAQQGVPLSDIEVLIIDDKSIDTSHIDIAKNYIKQYKMNIKFFETVRDVHCPGNSRNVGLDNATNDWVVFLDHDDKFVENSFAEIVEILRKEEDPLLIWTPFIQLNEQGQQLTPPQLVPTMSHGKFYNRVDLLQKYNFRFKDNMVSHEDLYLNTKILNYLERKLLPETKVLQTNRATYCWCHNETSIMNHYHIGKHFDDLIEALGMTCYDGAKEGNIPSKRHMMDLLIQLYFFTELYKYKQDTETIEKYNIFEYNNKYKQTLYDDLKITKEEVEQYLLHGEEAAKRYSSLYDYAVSYTGESFIPTQTLKDFIS